MFQWNAKVKEQQKPQSGKEQVQTRGSEGSPPKKNINKNQKAALEEARELLQAKRYDEALKTYEAILEKNQDAIAAYMGIGNIHAARGNNDEALQYYNSVLHLKKDSVQALMMAGNIYVRQEKLAEALEKFKEVLTIKPGAGNASLSAAKALAKIKQHDEAIKVLREALVHNPQLNEARLALASIYQSKGDSDAATNEITTAITSNPEFWQGHSMSAKMLLAKREFKKAIDALKKAIFIKPENASLHNLLGRTYSAVREFDLALAEFQKAIDIDAGMISARIGIVRMYIELGKLAEARKLLIGMSTGSRNLMIVHRLLADIMMRQNQYTEAVAEFKAAILHGKKLIEKHPELASIVAVPDNDKQTAEAYEKVFAKIESEKKFTIEETDDVESA